MRKIDQYVRSMEICLANAAKAPFGELRAVWETLGNSYGFLAELESWPGFSVGRADGDKSAPPVQRFNDPPTDDRILP